MAEQSENSSGSQSVAALAASSTVASLKSTGSSILSFTLSCSTILRRANSITYQSVHVRESGVTSSSTVTHSAGVPQSPVSKT